MTTTAAAPTFSPVPQRALRDDRLKLLDIRVLGAIASHDRFNANGQACWASNERLAEVLDCHVKSIPRAITRLIELGYVRDIGARPGKRRSRARFLTVIYNEADQAAFARNAEKVPVQPAAPIEEDAIAHTGHAEEAPEAAAAPVQPSPVAPRAACAEGNLAGYLEGNLPGYPKRTGKHWAEALGSPGKVQTQRRAPPRPPPNLRSVLDRRGVAQRDLALMLGNGDLTKGYEILSRMPDARRTEDA